MNVTTNIGKKFISLIEKHFPKTNIFHKIFNRNTIKISYSCMPNMDNIIKTHNSRIINSTKPIEPINCNCRNKENCPLPNRCTIKNVIYKAIVTTSNSKRKSSRMEKVFFIQLLLLFLYCKDIQYVLFNLVYSYLLLVGD